ncbi:MAG: hydrogenase nickel incorporation protein HypB [Rhodocyclales bacterium]|nr:hydrogenase nickel incorporation protein HypB [Rhodocyclales bacterium]
MCTTCGCGTSEIHIEGQDADLPAHDHVAPDGKVYRHVHNHPGNVIHVHSHDHDHGLLHFGLGAAHSHAPGMTQSRMLRIERDILAKNSNFAAANRQRFQEQGVLALNLMSSPGSGKTSLLVRTIEALQGRTPLAVIEGDQQTSVDAERIRHTGTPAVQVNTGKGCHLDASMVGRALARLDAKEASLLFIENVGNLVCPAAFDLGEAAKVTLLSVTEGEDKPLKYPDMFRVAHLLLLNKCDLLPYVDFDVERAIANARRINPSIEIISLSAKTGEGFDGWLSWIARAHDAILLRRQEIIGSRHVVEPETQLR